MTATAAPTTPTIEVFAPADGSLVAVVPNSSPAGVAATIHVLRAHQPAWEALGARDRAAWLRRYGRWIRAHQNELATLMQRETGKPLQEARLEIVLALDLLNYCARNAARFLAEHHPRPHGLLTTAKKLTVRYRPYPVVGVICPWNVPLLIALGDALPALAAGAAVVVKPSELTPVATRRVVEGWREIGAPNVLSCITGAGATGAAVVDGVDFVQFTGSARTGRVIADRAAQRMIPCSLELGGKDAAIVAADADLDRAAAGVVWGALFNSGQACVAVERVYVEAPVHDEFVAKVVQKVGGLRQGPDGRGYQADIGALASEAQLRIVEGQVEDAVGKGATILTGGWRAALRGTFFEPTVLVDVDHSMDIMREESFGPTIPIMAVADIDEAIRLTNDSPYGLSATVWTRDKARGRRIARAIEAGAVNVNDTFTNLFTFPVPHSGWKQSGIGARFGGAHTLRKYCRPQAITETRIAPKSELLWYPYTARRGRTLAAALRIAHIVDRHRRSGRIH